MTKFLKIISTIFILANTINFATGQNKNNDYLMWNAKRKLNLNDLIIKTKDLQSSTSFVQFYTEHKVMGLDFMRKNFNKKVQNYIIKTASWIDTTYNVNESLRYEQTLWDMCEIYTRQFRKALRDNRGKIANGLQIVNDLNSELMAEFSKRRILYDTETRFGTIEMKQQEWEVQIQVELKELDNFAYEK